MGNYIRKTKRYSSTADTNWSKEEEKILIENYKILDVKDIASQLKRTVPACRTKMYNLSKKEGKIITRSKNYANRWKQEEDEVIKANYAKKGATWCARQLKRTEKACIHRAGILKIKREVFWTTEEDEILKKYYPQYGSKKVSKLLGKSQQTCYTRAYVLGVHYDNNKWTKEQTDFIKKYYPLKGAEYVSKTLGRSIVACHSRAAILKLKHPKYWTKEEINFLKENYPKKGSIWVAKQLNRPRQSCKSIASKLKIKFEDEMAWKPKEIEILKQYYPMIGKFVVELLPNRSESSCTNQANRLGIGYQKQESSSIEKIKSILEQKQVIYKTEVGFKECKDKKMLLFDIAIYQDENREKLIGLIEYDGMQHFFPTTLYQDKTISANKVLERTKRHDKIKNEFCFVHEIPLLRIKYSQNNLEELVTRFLMDLKTYQYWYNPFISYKDYYGEIEDELVKEHYIHFSKYRKNNGYQKNQKPEYCFFKWTMEEDLYLEKYYPDKGSKWVSKYLHRSPNACSNRAHRLGLYRSNRWNREEDLFLIKNYKEKEAKWCAEQLNRTTSSIAHRANELKLKKASNKWQQQEEDYLIKYYTIKETKEIAKDINRTVQAVENRVRYLKKCKPDVLYGGQEAKVVRIPIELDRKTEFFLRKYATNYRGGLYLFKEGQIVAKCNLIDCKRTSTGEYRWIIKDFEVLESPVEAKGKNGIWKHKLQEA